MDKQTIARNAKNVINGEKDASWFVDNAGLIESLLMAATGAAIIIDGLCDEVGQVKPVTLWELLSHLKE